MGNRGKIKNVYCKNFVTYDECEFRPTAYLNVIIGPNGSGKSTLVSAIVLCLGGEPKLLARASSIKDYVKNGCEIAKVSVELYKENDINDCSDDEELKTIVYMRVFDKENTSKFYINNGEVSKSEYLKSVASFNIQIGNLCQFLPQDRVQDFAKMNPQEILSNTMNSVCTADVVKSFEDLKELRSKHKCGKENHQTLVQNLQDAKQRLDELNQQLERFNSRKDLEEKVNVCQIKQLRLEATETKNNLKELDNDMNLAKELLDRHDKEYNKIVAKQSQIEEINRKLKEDMDRSDQQVKKAHHDKTVIVAEVEQLERKVFQEKCEFEKCKRERGERELEFRNELKLLEICTQDIRNLKSEVSSDAQLLNTAQENSERYKQEIRRLNQDHTQLGQKLDELIPETQNVKRHLGELENVAKQKLEFLKTKFPDVYKAIEWLEQNEHMFEAPVYKPVMLEVSVRNPHHAKYVENSIGFRDMLVFCCESSRDMSLLTDELCVKRKLLINVGHTAPPSDNAFSPSVPIDQIRRYGFEAYLIDLIDGPPSVLGYLCSLYKLHNIPIGSDNVTKFTDQVPTDIRHYYGGKQSYSLIISKYSKESSLTQTPIEDKGLLCSRDEKRIQGLKSRYEELVRQKDAIQNKRSSVEAEMRAREFSYKQEMKTINEITRRKGELRGKEEELKRRVKRTDTLRQNLGDIPTMEAGFKENASKTLENIINVQKRKIAAFKSLQTSIANKEAAKAKMQIFKAENNDMIEAITRVQGDRDSARARLDEIKDRGHNLKAQYNRKLNAINNLCNNGDPNDRNSSHFEFYSTLPDSPDELKDIINDYSGRLVCMDSVNHEIFNEFDEKRKEIESLERRIESNLDENRSAEQRMTSIFQNWFHIIQQMLNTISQHFSDFMQSMGYVGEVGLTRKDEFDFDSYGIEILVQYRKKVALQPLNRHVQSGGERAVAIAVYTLSMQHINNVPFRCVDEINQGMDASNERKIFNMLVDVTTKAESSQYFFVTPKLLRNLKTHERMTVHIVFNGRMVQPRNAFDLNVP